MFDSGIIRILQVAHGEVLSVKGSMSCGLMYMENSSLCRIGDHKDHLLELVSKSTLDRSWWPPTTHTKLLLLLNSCPTQLSTTAVHTTLEECPWCH
jgi:hypothetical protein